MKSNLKSMTEKQHEQIHQDYEMLMDEIESFRQESGLSFHRAESIVLGWYCDEWREDLKRMITHARSCDWKTPEGTVALQNFSGGIRENQIVQSASSTVPAPRILSSKAYRV